MKSNIPAYLETAPAEQPASPPVTTRHQELPFGELTWENFERLCLRVARREADIRQCFLYGNPGQAQRGIDFIGFAGDVRNREIRVYQCKREDIFGPAKIIEAVDSFLDGQWEPPPQAFVLCAKTRLRTTQAQDEIQRQIARLAERGSIFTIWDSETLSERLKTLPDLVDDFFGRGWVEAFNGPASIASFGVRLSGPDTSRLRSRLFELYSTLFDRHDPGLPGQLPGRVPYRDRYVSPEVSEHRAAVHAAPPEVISGQEQDTVVHNEAHALASAVPPDFRREHPISSREFTVDTRQPILDWLPKAHRTVVLGEPGIGKSALLRFVALSLLDPESPDPSLAAAWGERLPVWLSFNAWTRALAHDEATNLEDFLFTWLHEHTADDVKPLLAHALQDRRLLLLIDGLDEQHNQAAANVALDRLDTFLSVHDIPVVFTSRPVGYERVMRPAGEWRHGRLMDFGPQQIRQFAKFWFLWLCLRSDSVDPDSLAAARETAQLQVERFIVELQAAPRILDLARVPLLLTLLIELSRFEARLPDHRIKAYDKMVDHLLIVHPARRQRAAGTTEHRPLIHPDDLKEAMARLALRIQTDHGGGYAPIDVCRDSLVDYLSDQVHGPGYPRGEAWDKASQAIEHAQTSLGLLVERSPGELGFIHLTVQEYLAAWAVSRMPDEAQRASLAEHWTDPAWREVLLALIGIHGVLRRDRSRVEALVDLLRAESQSALDSWRQWELLAEIVFSDLGLTPLRARVLGEDILDTIERCPFRDLSSRLAQAAARGLRSEHVRDVVQRRIALWFPARDPFSRAGLLKETARWQPLADLRAALTLAIRDEDVRCRIAAAAALSTVFSGDLTLGQELFVEAKRAVRPEVREACLAALANGWPTIPGLAELAEAALHDRYAGVRLSGSLVRISLGIHAARDLDALWALGSWHSSVSIWREDELVRAILRGWPGAHSVKERCFAAIGGLNPYDRQDDLRPESAWKVLVQGFSGDSDVAAFIARHIRTHEHPFSLGHATWELLAAHFKADPALSDAVVQYLKRRWQTRSIEHFGPDEAYACITASNEELRDILLQSFPAMSSLSHYWAAVALAEGWPADHRVQTFLRTQLAGPIDVASEVVPFIGRLNVSLDEQKRQLTAVVGNSQARRVWIAFSALAQISSEHDAEVLELGLNALGTRRWIHDEVSLKSILIQTFPSEERVVRLARELWEQQDTFPEFLAGIYSTDLYFRPRFLAALRPAESVVRDAIAVELGAAYVPQELAVPLLKGALYESDPVVRTKAILSMATHGLRDSGTQEWLLNTLSTEITALGMHYEGRRGSAVAGLLRLNRYDLLLDQQDPQGFGHGLEAWRPNPVVVREYLRSWRALKDAFQDQLFHRLGRSRADFWEAAAPWVDEFPDASLDFQSHLREVAGTTVGPNTLDGMARLLPGSDELRDTCLVDLRTATLQRLPLTNVPRILGTHFGGQGVVLARVLEILESSQQDQFDRGVYWRLLLSLCYGWPDVPVVQEWLARPRANWKGMPWHIALHLDRIARKPDWFLNDLLGCLKASAPYDHVRDDEIPKVLTLWASSEANRSLLSTLLEDEHGSDVATATGLLSQGGAMSQELKRRFEELFEAELGASQRPPRVGLALSQDRLRPVAEILFEVLGGVRDRPL